MNYNNNKSSIDKSSIDKSSIGLLQGKELRKYENQYKIDAIPHLRLKIKNYKISLSSNTKDMQ